MVFEINRNSVRIEPESLSDLTRIITYEIGTFLTTEIGILLSGMGGRFEPESTLSS